eukprot:1053547-Amphidinium_carterae.1
MAAKLAKLVLWVNRSHSMHAEYLPHSTPCAPELQRTKSTGALGKIAGFLILPTEGGIRTRLAMAVSADWPAIQTTMLPPANSPSAPALAKKRT